LAARFIVFAPLPSCVLRSRPNFQFQNVRLFGRHGQLRREPVSVKRLSGRRSTCLTHSAREAFANCLHTPCATQAACSGADESSPTSLAVRVPVTRMHVPWVSARKGSVVLGRCGGHGETSSDIPGKPDPGTQNTPRRLAQGTRGRRCVSTPGGVQHAAAHARWGGRAPFGGAAQGVGPDFMYAHSSLRSGCRR